MLIKYLSLFSGIGGFEIPLNKLGWQCIGYSEIDRYAIKVYERRFNADIRYLQPQDNEIKQDSDNLENELQQRQLPNNRDRGHHNYGDITRIKAEQLPDFDLLVGGFPCQAFSIAGKRRGFDDTRGTLFFDIARILAEKRPRHLVLENVKGLLSHDGGKTFQTILGVLSDLGYRIEWQVLNSKDFGVPQNRERIIIVGHLRGECSGKVFPIFGSQGKNLEQLIGGSQGNRVYDVSGSSSTIASQAGGLGAKTGLYAMRGRGNPPKQTLEERQDGNTNTITSVQKDNLVAMRWVRTEKGKEMRREAQKNGKDYTPFNGDARTLVPSDSDVIGTITSQAVSKDSLLGHGTRIRRLTPLECERLQGFPDNWTEGESDTQRYKMCGNAVTTNVVEAVMRSLKDNCLNNKEEG